MPKISIIIITLNEEDYLPDLLESIDRQEYDDYEVIVSDADSEDRTPEIARERDVHLIQSRGKGPGHGRNRGAKEAKGDILFFLDADSELIGTRVLDNIVESIEDGGNVVGTSTAVIKGKTIRGRLFFRLSNLYMKIVNRTGITFMAPGSFQYIKRDIFEKIGGYDEDLPFYEDEDMVSRAMNHGGFETLSKQHYMSSRRTDQKGIIRTITDYIPPQIYRILGREQKMKEKFSFETTGSEE